MGISGFSVAVWARSLEINRREHSGQILRNQTLFSHLSVENGGLVGE